MVKITPSQIEKMAIEVRQFLIDKEIWIDTTIYFNGRAYSTSDRNGTYAYNDKETLIELENVDPKAVTEYAGEILTMTFDGPLYDCINCNGEYSYEFAKSVVLGLHEIFQKYGCYYELGEAWNLTLYQN